MRTGETTTPNTAHVLVVDDDPGIRSLLRDLLEDAGYRVSVVANGPAGLALLAGVEQATVVLLDQSMPPLSGVEVAAIIAQDERLAQRCACLLLTGSADGLTHTTDLPLLSKPFELDTLEAAVATAAQQLQSRSRCRAGRA